VGDDQPRLVTGGGPGENQPIDRSYLEELMGGFRPSAAGATARFAAEQAAILRDLVGQVIELIIAESPDADAGARHADDGLGDADLDDPDLLEALSGMGSDREPPDDPVLARLLPNAYRDDPKASGEFRRYTERSLRSGKAAAARTVLATLPPRGGRIKLSEPEAQAWLRALNDVRLALGTRLGVTDDFDDQARRMEPDDPLSPVVGVYQWLAFLQETLVEALS
jgi:hypothetical protein